jgi:tRNA threonylcarbamoyladenosine biosynthesis protein TsaE
VICFFGNLGAGKTTLIKGIVSELTGIDIRMVNSPTFNYVNIYEGVKTLYHLDLYRLTGAKDFLEHGFDEYFDKFCCIEWGEKIKSILPPKNILITIKYLSKNKRYISCAPRL